MNADPIETNNITNNTTKKRSTFLSTPLTAITSLTLVPGIGSVTLERLARVNITHPQQLVGQFMLLNSDADAMAAWLRQSCAVRQREADVIVEALVAKCERLGCV